MARIKIEDLPKDMEITGDELKRVAGGASGLKWPRGEAIHNTYSSDWIERRRSTRYLKY